MATYTLGHGTKIEYSSTESGTYTRLYGATSIPEIGGDAVCLPMLEFFKNSIQPCIIAASF